MGLCGVVDAIVCREGDHGAEGVGIVGVAEAPEVFDFAGGEGGDLFEVEVGGEGFYAGGAAVFPLGGCL